MYYFSPMKILCVIPARFGSQRFPGKPIFPIAGRPMIEWVYEAAQKSEAFSEIIVATDDQRIFEVVERFGGKAQFTSKNHPSGTDRLLEVRDQNTPFDAYVNLQGDEPLMDPIYLSEFAKRLGTLESGSILTPVGSATRKEVSDPNVVKVIADVDHRACYFSRSPIPYLRDDDGAEEVFLKHIGLYGFTLGALDKIKTLAPHPIEKAEKLEQLRWLLNGIPIYVHKTNYESMGVDTKAQALQVEKILKGTDEL